MCDFNEALSEAYQSLCQYLQPKRKLDGCSTMQLISFNPIGGNAACAISKGSFGSSPSPEQSEECHLHSHWVNFSCWCFAHMTVICRKDKKIFLKEKGKNPSVRSLDLFPPFSRSQVKKGHFAKWKQCCTELLCIKFQVCNCDCVMDLSRE